MLKKIKNIGVNSLKRQNFGVMKNKIMTRIKEHQLSQERSAIECWCKERAESYEEFARSLNSALWAETVKAHQAIKTNGESKLEALGLNLGGGGNYPLLYFFTRYLNAQTVVETGVAAGWSSQAVLTALKVNDARGELFSSDFPYFRYENPEKYVGYIVDAHLKERWQLYIDGDQNNLPKIVASIDNIDLFHYDSDKSYAGRTFAMQALEAKFSDRSVIIFDDIQDNHHFKDHVEKNNLPFRVFAFEGKYMGLIADFCS